MCKPISSYAGPVFFCLILGTIALAFSQVSQSPAFALGNGSKSGDDDLTPVMKAILAEPKAPQNLTSMPLTPCVSGMAGPYACDNIDLVAQLSHSAMGGGTGNDIWGWTDPVDGTEYAIVGNSTGTAFVSLSDPENPLYLGRLPSHNGVSSTWRDMKVYADHAFIVADGNNGHGMQVFDLTQLRNVVSPPVTFSNTAHYSEIQDAHNIVINEQTGYAYLVGGTNNCSSGLHMVDISTPITPTFAGCFSADGYTHDAQCVIYTGPDVAHQGQEICINSNEDTITIVDVTNKVIPMQLSRTGYAGSGYTHQGWLTEDQTYFLLGDELDESSFGHNTRTYIWDVSDLDNPLLIDNYTGPNASIDHNLYVKGGYVFESNYSSGLRILDLTDIANGNLVEEGFFDTYPADNNVNFNGQWSNYPFFDSGLVIANDRQNGLFVLSPTSLTADFSIYVSPPTLAVCTPNDAVYTVDVSAFSGFAEPVTLSASGHPNPPDSAVFSNNNSTPPFTSTLTIGTNGALTGTYNIAVVGVSPTSTHTTTVELILDAAPPVTPTLAAPADGASGVSDSPTFEWTAVGGATDYSIEVATDPGFSTLVYSATVSAPATTHTVGISLEFNTLYYWRVTATNGCGSGSPAAAFSFTTMNAPGSCGVGTYALTVYESDLEDGAPGWTHSGIQDTWQLTDVRTTSGSNAWHAEDTSTLSDQRLASPLIDIPSLAEGSDPKLLFQNYQAFEEPNTDGRCWDAGILEVSTNGGTTWSQVPASAMLSDPYDNIIWNDSPGNNPITNDYGATEAWCDPNQEFLNALVDISAYAGQTVQFAWRLGSDSFVGNEGWYIDDVKVQACTDMPPMIEVEPSSMESTQAVDSVVTQTLTISNTGVGDLSWAIVEQAPSLGRAQGGWEGRDKPAAGAPAGYDDPLSLSLMTCDVPGDIPWVTVNPVSGMLLAATAELVDVTFDSSGLAAGVYSGTLCINSNDGTNPLIPVPLTMTVASNAVPVAVADTYSTTQDVVLSVPAPGVLSNDSDGDGQALMAVLDSDVSHGLLTLAGDGGFVYTPTMSFVGSDSFSYYATDGIDASMPVSVTITVETSSEQMYLPLLLSSGQAGSQRMEAARAEPDNGPGLLTSLVILPIVVGLWLPWHKFGHFEEKD